MTKKITLLIIVPLLLVVVVGYIMYKNKGTIPSVVDTQVVNERLSFAYFAGGCFWCVESDFEKMTGITEVLSGYMGGETDEPTYKEVSAGTTGHRESVKITYDPVKTTYRDLVLHLLRYIDPTDDSGSFQDRGFQYTPAIYYNTEEEKNIALAVIAELEEEDIFPKDIVVSVEPSSEFWIAEEYHQDYYKKNPVRYKYYRSGSGRDVYLETIWGDGEHDEVFESGSEDGEVVLEIKGEWVNYIKPSDEKLKDSLTSLQYKVTQKEGTEKPFDNEYDANKEKGIYVDILSGEPLFASVHKFDSGTGWPSFWQPIDKEMIVLKEDKRLFTTRTEVRSKYSDSHIGHVFNDGPDPTGLRYCMNSAAMRFVPLTDMEAEGYGDYLILFN